MCLRGPEKQPRVLVFLTCHDLKIRNEIYDALKFAKSAKNVFFNLVFFNILCFSIEFAFTNLRSKFLPGETLCCLKVCQICKKCLQFGIFEYFVHVLRLNKQYTLQGPGCITSSQRRNNLKVNLSTLSN